MEKFLSFFTDILIEALGQTIYMVGISTILATLIGFILAIVLVVTDDGGLKPNKIINSILGFIVNTLRSFPFIILVVAIIPLTRAIVGKSIGETAALVPLTIGAAPFIARVIEGALKEVDKGLIEAAKSFGASNFQIIFKVMIKEAMPSIVSGITLSTISILGYTAMAGAIGAGGLGNLAYLYGMVRSNNYVMYTATILILIIVFIIQFIGDYYVRKIDKR